MSEPESPGKSGPGAARYAGLGLQLAASIILFVFLGQWLDKRTGWGPLFTILGAFIGFGGFMWSLIRQLNREAEEHPGGQKRPPGDRTDA